MKHIVCKGPAYLLGLHELGEVDSRKTETQHIHRFKPLLAITGRIQAAGIAFLIFLFAVNIPSYTKPKFKIIFSGFCFLIMVIHHPQIIKAPLGVLPVTLDGILNRSGNLSLLLLQEIQLFIHDRLLISEGEYIRGLMHNRAQIYIAKGLPQCRNRGIWGQKHHKTVISLRENT